MDLSKQEFLNELGLEEHLNNYNGELRKLGKTLSELEKPDPQLIQKIIMEQEYITIPYLSNKRLFFLNSI